MRVLLLFLCMSLGLAGRDQVKTQGKGELTRKGCGPGYCFKGGNTNLRAFFSRSTGTALNFHRLGENNLINGGKMVFKQVGKVGRTHIDLVITNPGGGYKKANRHYRWRRRSGYWFARRYNRAYKGCGMMGSLRAGTHQFQFTFVRHRSNQKVRIPYLPWTMYDLDGGKEYPSTRDAVGIMTYNPTGIRAGCSGGRCYANAARREYPFPRNFNRLNRRSKMASVTFLFRNKASFLMSYRTTYPHRVFIFKGSLTAMKPRSPLPRKVSGGSNPRRRVRQARRRTRRRQPIRRRRTRSVRRRRAKGPRRDRRKPHARGCKVHFVNRLMRHHKWAGGCR